MKRILATTIFALVATLAWLKFIGYEPTIKVASSTSPDGRYRCDIRDRDHRKNQFTYTFETFALTNAYEFRTHGTTMTLGNDSVPADNIQMKWTNDTLYVSGSLGNYTASFTQRTAWWSKN